MAADPHDPLPSPLSGVGRARALWPLAAASLALVTASFALRAVLLKVRHFGPDEFHHLHRSWCVARGLLPHRDFFDHHPSGLPLLLRPLFALFEDEGRPRSGAAWGDARSSSPCAPRGPSRCSWKPGPTTESRPGSS